MAMVSMETDESFDSPQSGKYGYGLTLHLNDDQCEALGIKQPLRAGAKVSIKAAACVMNVTESVEDDGDDTGNDVSMCLQITDMELMNTGQEDPASMLYSADDS